MPSWSTGPVLAVVLADDRNTDVTCWAVDFPCTHSWCVFAWLYLQVSVALDEASRARQAAEAALKEALSAVKEAEAAYRQKVGAR